MTVLASLPPAMARLFERIDAAEPASDQLRVALRYWQAKRSGRLTPTVADVTDRLPDMTANAFILRRVPADGDWLVEDAGAAVRDLLRPRAEDARLSRLGSRRIAVRLRRIGEMVAETGEPITATFELDGKAARRRRVEVMIAPLSTGGGRIDALFGAVAARWKAG